MHLRRSVTKVRASDVFSTFSKVRNSEESKDWIADPSNRVCDAPGSWYCPSDALMKFLRFTAAETYAVLSGVNPLHGPDLMHTLPFQKIIRTGS